MPTTDRRLRPGARHHRWPGPDRQKFTLRSWTRPRPTKSAHIGLVDEPKHQVQLRAMGVCVSRAGLERSRHEPDRDGKCCFCDQAVPEES